mgnify:CR=1 FL=1
MHKTDRHTARRLVERRLILPENEIEAADARALVKTGCRGISEGANMPSTPDAIDIIRDAGIMHAPSKAANAGGVAVSGLEMSQNSLRMSWSREEVDEHLKKIILNIHTQCVDKGGCTDHDRVDYFKGANIAGFDKVANAMLAYGAV